MKREAAREDIRAFDARTGRLLWTFHVVPQPGEPGNETWGEESWKYSGDLGSWCCITGDEELGYVYIPLTAPTAAYYGGHRPGDNLYSDSLVCLEARTGKIVWHFQMVHHDVWEYDTVGPAILGDITVGGRRIKAVMQPSKTGFLYVFDRVTGEPVWPIEERPVSPSPIASESLSPTQPFPTKPAPFDRQGFTEDDLIDFTPRSMPAPSSSRGRSSSARCSRRRPPSATSRGERRALSRTREHGARETGTPVPSTPRPGFTTPFPIPGRGSTISPSPPRPMRPSTTKSIFGRREGRECLPSTGSLS